jgi:hypothetical protein
VKDDVGVRGKRARHSDRKAASSSFDTENWLHGFAARLADKGEWAGLQVLLIIGSERPKGVRLTRSECRILWQILSGERKRQTRRGRPFDLEAENKAKWVAWYTLLLEEDGALLKNAITAAMQLYGVSRASVFAARKEWGPKIKALGPTGPERRRLMIDRSEAVAPLFQSK